MRRIADAVGFPYRYDSLLDAYIHPAGFIVAAPEGVISRYIEGFVVSSSDLVAAFADAQQDRSQGPLTRLLLLCHIQGAPLGRLTVPVTAPQFGQIGSAFFLLLSISAALIGFLVNRVSTKLVLAVMAFTWAATQLPMLGAVSVPVLMASRIALGAGEGPAYPVALHAVYRWFPNESRAFPTGFVSIGGPLGIGLAAPLLTRIILTCSWQAAFVFLGVVGFIWVAIWLVVGQEGPLDAHQVEAGAAGLEHVPYSMLLMSRTFVGVTLAGFAAYWVVTLAVVWLPSFLIKAAGYSPTATGWIVMLPPLLQLCLSPALGLVSQKLRARNLEPSIIRCPHHGVRCGRRARDDPAVQIGGRFGTDSARHGGLCGR